MPVRKAVALGDPKLSALEEPDVSQYAEQS